MKLPRVRHIRVTNPFTFISTIGTKSENRDIGNKLTVPELELSFLIMTDLDIQVSKCTRSPVSLSKGRISLFRTFCYVILSSTQLVFTK